MSLALAKGIKKAAIIITFSIIAVLMLGMKAKAATYTVTAGDSLYKVGLLFQTNSNSIMTSNSLTSSTIYPGQQLTVPGDIYTVKSGDTLYLIAKRYGITLQSLQKANQEWDGVIYPGQKLILPTVINGVVKLPDSIQSATTGQNGVIPYTQNDVELLARLIMSEAEGEPYTGKVAVGAVVVNRVQSELFPNNLHDVIYQRINGYYQFTPVLLGTINKPANADSTRAAYAALSGIDPTNGALFYFDDSATNQWLLAKPVSIVIQNMIFSY